MAESDARGRVEERQEEMVPIGVTSLVFVKSVFFCRALGTFGLYHE